MNKIEFIEAISKDSGLTKKDTTIFLDSVINVITETLSNGGNINIAGFGKFEVRSRGERKGVNPRTGESITISKCNIPSFKAGANLKKAVNGIE